MAGLATAGVTPAEVTPIFISHHHPDHTVNIALFPNAEIVDVWASYRGDLWRDHADTYALGPGITVLRTPGHTEEDASLIVQADDGTYVLTHLGWLEDMTPETDPLAWDQATLEASRQQVLAIADWIIPGHGRVFRKPRKGYPSPFALHRVRMAGRREALFCGLSWLYIPLATGPTAWGPCSGESLPYLNITCAVLLA